MTNHRFVARCLATGDTRGVRLTARLTALLALATSLPVLAVIWFAAPYVATACYHRPDLIAAFRIGGATVPLTSLMLTLLAVPQGARNVIPYLSVWLIGHSVVFLGGALVVVPLGGDAEGLMWAYAASMAVGCLASGVWLLAWLPQAQGEGETDIRLGELARFSATMLLKAVSTLLLLTADVWILRRYVSSSELGVYFAASRTAMLVGFPRTSINPVLSPTASALHAQGDLEGLRRQYVAATRWTVGASLAIFGVIQIAPGMVMRVFGGDFAGGGGLLTVLSWSWLVQAAFAGSQFVLIMTGGQKVATATEWVGAVLFVAALPWICAHSGTMGAAVWVLLSVIGVNCARELNLHHRLGLHPFDGRFLWASAASAALLWPLTGIGRRFGDRPVVLAACVGAFLLAFAAICWYGWMPELAARVRRRLRAGQPAG
jgi:O-antigen/teichoic acid export membrane protein